MSKIRMKKIIVNYIYLFHRNTQDSKIWNKVFWNQRLEMRDLKTFTMNNWWTRFIIFSFRDPHLLESWEGSKDWTTNPHRVFSFRWSNNLNLHCWWSKSCEFFCHSFFLSAIPRNIVVKYHQKEQHWHKHHDQYQYHTSWWFGMYNHEHLKLERDTTSGHFNLSLPITITLPSGSS